MNDVADAVDLVEWIASIPELATRPLGVDLMRDDKRLRREIFKVHQDLIMTATRLVNTHVAAELLGLLWDRRSKEFTEKWREKLGKPAFAQCYSTIRNIYKNAVVRATGKPQQWKEHDIERRVPQHLLEMVLSRFAEAPP